jgi:hypothetical protein
MVTVSQSDELEVGVEVWNYFTFAGALAFWEVFFAAAFSLTGDGPPFFAVLGTLIAREAMSIETSSDARLVPV